MVVTGLFWADGHDVGFQSRGSGDRFAVDSDLGHDFESRADRSGLSVFFDGDLGVSEESEFVIEQQGGVERDFGACSTDGSFGGPFDDGFGGGVGGRTLKFGVFCGTE